MNTMPQATRDDVASGRALAELAPFFGSDGAATRFVRLALDEHWTALAVLGPRLRCIDVGGGEGIVAAALRREADLRGIACEALVVDANPRFLQAAAGRGLPVHLGGPGQLPAGCAELVLLRFVNHYQSAAGQEQLARQVARLLVRGGYLAAQIHTAAPQVCALFDEVALWITGSEVDTGRHWAPLEEFLALFELAGLRLVRVIGESVRDEVPIEELVDDAWSRVHGKALQERLKAGEAVQASGLLAARDALRARARRLARDRGLPTRLPTLQPIVVMQLA
jgi:hypothetical protein